ncbi:hypothetical protein B9Z55_011606 [Caenorhabditis nigoni]|uniref:Uncharacterized protein n=1 Tax=Caenorhabditis nigoni TaxID=1611254 RepID=A0A2G5ULE7_9PELO|nr:hypothetical protein B9Z55_011606 [Caenorhabditis nigoni]
MPPSTLAEAEQFLRSSKIEESILERLGEMLVTKMDGHGLESLHFGVLGHGLKYTEHNTLFHSKKNYKKR